MLDHGITNGMTQYVIDSVEEGDNNIGYNEGTTLVKQQLALEEAMLEECHATQYASLSKASERKGWSIGIHEWSDTKPGQVYTKTGSQALLETLMEFIHTKAKGSGQGKQAAGKANAVATFLNECGLRPDVIAWLTAKVVFNSVVAGARRGVGVSSHGSAPTISRVALAIGKALHDEWRMKEFINGDKRTEKLVDWTITQAARSESKTNKVKNLHKLVTERGETWEAWSRSDRGKIGRVLLEMFKDSTGMVEYGGPRAELLLTTEEFDNHLEELLPRQLLSYTKYRPMVVPPRDWTKENLFRGCYISDKTKRYPIIKGSGKRDVERFLRMDWSQVLPAINAIQSTPWRISKRMLKAVEWAYYEYSRRDTYPKVKGLGKLPPCDKIEFPAIPPNIEDPEVKRKNQQVCAEIHSWNKVNRSKRRSALMTFAIAKDYQGYERIYFPHDLDSRGRAYPITHFLTPQGPDFAKSMLEFAEGQPILTEGDTRWLLIHLANSYGKDKISLSERVQWAKDNEEMILSCGTDYTQDLRWTHADEPFAFLRACMEWQEFKGYGYGYVSRVVIPVDATCSGLQHYAAMFRDEVGGRSVNLVPGLSRQDIYGDVAQVAVDKLRADGSDTALRWIAFGIDRKLTKRQVMVVPYAGKFSSCIAYTREAVKEKCLEPGVELWFDIKDRELDPDPIMMLARVIWDAIDEVVVKGKEGMKWLGQMASLWSSHANKNIEGTDAYARRMSWLTPDGFEVVHYRPQSERKLIETTFGGRLKISMYEETGWLESRDMNSAVAPNFVHALDATLLRMTVNKALNQGIRSFAMIHDSFGVHAPLMQRFMDQAIKPAFVDLYSRDVVQEFQDSFPEIEAPPQPTRGGLVLEGVMESEFVFS